MENVAPAGQRLSRLASAFEESLFAKVARNGDDKKLTNWDQKYAKTEDVFCDLV